LRLVFLALVVCAAIAIPSGMLAAAAARRLTALSEGVLSE
jgi:ABC-type proline/glycine betaine transport system permease subunit